MATVVVEIGDVALAALARDGMRLAMAKSPRGVAPNAVWLAWAPRARSTVSWSETYGLFAACVPARAGVPIRFIASVRAPGQKALYPFSGTAFGEPHDAGRIPERHYQVRNDAAFAAGFGLSQRAALNSGEVVAPVNFTVLPPGFVADFAAPECLYLWLERGASGGSIIASWGSVIPFDYPRPGTVVRYHYVPERGFVVLDRP